MQTAETPEPHPEKPNTDHHFETPVVREARPAGAARKERDDAADEAEPAGPPERDMAFEDRWENVQTVFVARSRRSRQARLRNYAAVGTRAT